MSSDTNIRESGFGIRDSEIGNREPGIGNRGPGSISDFGFRISDSRIPNPESRIPIPGLALAVGALLALAAGGCSKEYEQKKLGKDSPEAQRVRAMVESLRQGGEKGLDGAMARQSAGGLTEAQAKAVEASLLALIRAESVELERFDRFGTNVYRATFTLTHAGNTRTTALLLVPQGSELRWAGRN